MTRRLRVLALIGICEFICYRVEFTEPRSFAPSIINVDRWTLAVNDSGLEWSPDV